MRLEYYFEGLEVCSTNSMYIPTRGKKGQKGAFLRKSPQLSEWQSKMKRMFESEIFHTKTELEEFKSKALEEKRAVIFYLAVSIPKNSYMSKSGKDLKVHDTSNMIKAIEDSFASAIGLDDKYTVFTVAQKGFNEGTTWRYNVILLLDEENTMYNKLEFENINFYDLNTKEDENDEENDS